MTISHHPASENLMTCSAGAMPEAQAAIMASHLDMCRICRHELSILETIGGALLEDLKPAPLASPETRFGAREVVSSATSAAVPLMADVPRPIQRFVGASFEGVRWKRVVSGIWQHEISLTAPEESNASLRLIKVAPGLALPDHGHSGTEMTLVLKGAFRDGQDTYHRGDFVEVDEAAEHAPIADISSECICLVAIEGKMRFRNLIARVAQRFLGF